MRIAICDNTIADLVTLVSMIKEFCDASNYTKSIDIFTSAEDLLTSTIPYDILFLDVYMGSMNGIDAAKIIHEKNNSLLVFTTTSKDHAVEAFGVDAVHYLIKPVTPHDIEDAMNRCLARLGKGINQIVNVKSGQNIIAIPMDHIVYIEVFNKLSTIHTNKKEIQTYTALDTIFEQLNSRFFMRAQRSFVVNMSCVDLFLTDRLFLTNGVEITLSRNNRPELKNQYKQFLCQLARRPYQRFS